jgi:mannosyltransferase
MKARRVDPVLAAVVAAGAVLRFWGLGGQSLWYDEWMTSEAAARGTLPELARHVAHREGTPPLYFGLVWMWVRLFGDSDVALRSISALVGVATVPVAYAIVRTLGGGRTVARVAALLVAVNPMLVWYAQEARAYSLVAFLGALSFLAFARLWSAGGRLAVERRPDLVAWALLSALVVAVHYFALFLVVVEGVALLVRWPGEWRSLLLAAVPSAVVLALLAPVAATQHSHETNRRWIAGFSLDTRLGEAGRSSLVGPSSPDGRLWIAVAAVVALAALLALVAVAAPAAARSPSSFPSPAAAALAGGVGAAALVLPVVLAATGVEDVVLGRYLVASLVPLAVAVAAGLFAAGPRWLGGAGVALVTVVSLSVVVAVQRDPDLQRPDWRQVAAVDEAGDADRALVVNVGGIIARPLLRYLDDARALAGGETARVDEIDVLYVSPTSRPCDFLVGRACGFLFLGSPPPEPLASQLTLVERIELPQFAIERYRAEDGPLRVSRDDLVAADQRSGALVLVPAD